MTIKIPKKTFIMETTFGNETMHHKGYCLFVKGVEIIIDKHEFDLLKEKGVPLGEIIDSKEKIGREKNIC
jgi:hypothetical protein